MATNYNKEIERVSEETLCVLETIAASADVELHQPNTTGPAALASVNTFTSGEAIKTLSGIDAAKRRSLESQSREPAIARVVVRTDDDALIVYYICRDPALASPGPGRRLAGSKTPVGRLAALPVGEDFDIDTRGGGIAGVIVEKAILHIDDSVYALLKDYMGIARNQIMVDEATDFSPVQLACMGALASPGIQSFFACGDFNQRITAWGSRSTDEMRWAFPKIEVRPIQVSYRHSRQLNHLATEIVRLCSGETVDVVLPKDVNNEGVPPVLGTDLARQDDIASWLAQRIVEIERFTRPLPSVAVLVNDEADVGPLADGLMAALADENLNVVACYKGQFAGQENDIRVFDVQHIKGLEFEAVFFVGVDMLATIKPELFDKYLYVGATRAATYLGLTCMGPALPHKIEPLRGSFAADWKP